MVFSKERRINGTEQDEEMFIEMFGSA